tara:strand:+ start:362 stop:1552 length:1191 start_codon:yes stop_codon:yes gene_type:complete
MNRRGTFLSNEMNQIHCREYMAYPIGFAPENAVGNFQNSRLKGIKPSRHQRLPPRPVSIDVAAVSKAQGATNPFLAASIFAMQEQEKIIEQRKRPVEVTETLTPQQQFARYGQDERLLAEIGRTKGEVMAAFSKKKFELQESQDVRDEINEYYNRIARGTSLVRPVVASAETRADQLLEQVKGIRTEVKNLKLSQQRTEVASREAITEKLLIFRRNLDTASKDELISKLNDYIYRFGLAEPSQSSLQALNMATLKSRLEELEKKRLEGVIEEIQTLSSGPRVRLETFKRNYEKLSDAEKTNVFEQMIDEVQLDLGIDDPDEFEARFGEVTLDNLVDYIKNNSLSLPNLTPPEQLSGFEPMLPPPVQGMPREAGEAGSSTDPPPTEAPTEAPTESTM